MNRSGASRISASRRSVRVFVAIEPTATILDELTKCIERLRESWPQAPVRWVRPEQIHLTLRFLGHVAETHLRGLQDSIAEVAGRNSPLRLSLGRLGCFPNAQRPRVIWIGVRCKNGTLDALHSSLNESTSIHGDPPESRTFHPHLTLGRLQAGARLPRGWEEKPAGIVVSSWEDWAVRQIALIQSRLGAGGSSYETLAKFPLQV